MSVKTETISTDPWKFAATVTCGDAEFFHIGEEGESRAKVKRDAIKGMEAKLQKLYGSRN